MHVANIIAVGANYSYRWPELTEAYPEWVENRIVTADVDAPFVRLAATRRLGVAERWPQPKNRP